MPAPTLPEDPKFRKLLAHASFMSDFVNGLREGARELDADRYQNSLTNLREELERAEEYFRENFLTF